MNLARDLMTELQADKQTATCPPNCHHENDVAILTKTEMSPSSKKNPGRLLQAPALLVIGAVKLYQYLISPWLGRRCRFYPSCSQYFILSVQKFGLIRGLCKGTARICRCHPWNPGGYDPP